MVDEVREKYIISHKIYEQIPQSKYITQALKFFENELFYENISEWNHIIQEFENIPYKEITFPVDKLNIDKWFSLFRQYFSEKPTDKTRDVFIKAIGFSANDTEEINNLVQEIRSNIEVKEMILSLYREFDNIIL